MWSVPFLESVNEGTGKFRSSLILDCHDQEHRKHEMCMFNDVSSGTHPEELKASVNKATDCHVGTWSLECGVRCAELFGVLIRFG
jgi:hypothetical protein